MRAALTCDVFSALIDSRAGACPVFELLAREHGWPWSGAELYQRWDRRHKQLQASCRTWVPFAELGRQALADVVGGPGDAIGRLWASLPDWPLWPDVAQAVPGLAERYRVGLLSNVDDALLGSTRLAALPFDRSLVLTSERLGCYKPAAAFYRAAEVAAGEPITHLAASARDVRGALEAGIDTVRVVRPGRVLDPAGPAPTRQISSLSDLLVG